MPPLSNSELLTPLAPQYHAGNVQKLSMFSSFCSKVDRMPSNVGSDFRAFIVKLGDDDNAAPPLVESSIANRSKTALGCAISCIKLPPTYPDKKSPQLTE